jgi:glycosyltransferase involved in cell wall biosynthesis
VARTLEQIRDRGVPGFDVEVVGTDPGVDRRLAAVADVEMPYYAGLRVGVPSVPAIVDALADGRYDAVHLCTPGPAGVGAALAARMAGLPVVGSYHTELAAYAGLRSGDVGLRQAADMGLGAFYGACDVVLSPSRSADASLRALGIGADRIGRWDRGVDTSRFGPARREPGLFGPGVHVLYAGRLTEEKGIGLLADAFERAAERDGRLHMVLAGGGPEEETLRERLGSRASFLGWLDGDALARAYASAHAFLFPSGTDTFGQVILEAQASGLPVVAVGRGGPADLVRDGVTGLLREPDADDLAGALLDLAGDPQRRARLAANGMRAVRERTWEASMGRLADGYTRALAAPATAAQLAA